MANKKVDLNSARLEELESLIGVGHAKAEAILEARKAHGGFNSVSDLMKVPGIGPSVLDQNRCMLVCSSPTSPGTRKAPRKCERETRSSAKAELKFVSCDPSPNDEDDEDDNDDLPSAAERSQAPPTYKTTRTRSDTARKQLRQEFESVAKYDHQLPSTSQHLIKPETSSSSSSHQGLTDNNNDEEEEEEMPSTSGLRCDTTTSSEQDDSDADDECDLDSKSEGHEPMDESDSNDVRVKMEEESPYSPTFTIRSRIPIRVQSDNSKSWMKRKSDSGLDIRGLSPGKKPCRGSDLSRTYGEPDTSYGALRTKAHCQAAQRHRRIPSKNNPPPELADWLKTFQSWSNAERLLALDELIELCEPTQVRHMMAVIEPQFQRDFISLLPKELALYVLSFLDPKDLLRAAQTCRYWRILAEDNLLWREKCREESIEEAAVFGNKLRRKSCPGSPRSPWKSSYMRQHQIEQNWRHGAIRIPKVLKGHDDHVITCLEFCGSRIVSGSDDNTLKVWSALTGKCLRTLVGHTGGVWSSQMAGNIIISGSTDRTLKVWNADTGQCVHTLYGHTSTVRCMHLYENKVVSGSRDATLRLWDIDSGACLHVLMGHVAAVRCVQYDGCRVVSGAYDYMVKIWDPETETCLHTLQGHTNRVYSLQFDGIHIVSGSLDTSIRVWDVESGNCLHTLIGHQSLTSGMELKDNTLVSGNADSTVKVWDITTGQCLQTLQGPNKHQSAVTCLQFNKKFVITSSDDGTVKIWDLRTGEFLRNLVALDSGGSGGVVWRVRCSNTKLVCAVGSRNGTEETKLLVLDFDIDDGKKAIT